jgi:hypothetical protein
MFFVSNLRSSFQAVGRGFDPRLPLHVFNGLQGLALGVLRLCSVNSRQGSNLLRMSHLRGSRCAPFSPRVVWLGLGP